MTNAQTNYIYKYDGSFDGFLTAVFDIYENKKIAALLTASAEIQAALDAVVVEVITDGNKAARVEKGIIKNIGRAGFAAVLRVFSACDAHKDAAIYNFLRLAFKHGYKTLEMLGNADVVTYNEILGRVNYECHRMRGFVRFRETKSGVMYAPIRPDHDILEFIMPLFRDRFHIQKFAIYDVGRKKLGLYDGKTYEIGYMEDLPEVELTDDEMDLQRVWKIYYDAVSIESRKSERRRKNFMPARYWEFMTEITNDVDR